MTDRETALDELLAAVRAYIDLDPGEETFIICALATAVSKALVDEEPLWLFLIGAAGAGKSEAIRLLDLTADRGVDELTRAGLLSWSTGSGKKAKRSGLLTRIPRTALVTISDFSTVATMGDREARARMYGMLRVVYDGHVYRGIGGQASSEGDELEWSGHLTLVAGATPAIDAHTSVEAALGERWLTIRLAESSSERARRRAWFVIDRASVPPLRKRAQELARDLILEARERIPRRLDKTHEYTLVDAATLVATARTGVQFEGQGKGRVPVGIPTPEEPTRITGQLHRLARCTVALGVQEPIAAALAVRAGLDSVPLARMRALQSVAAAGDDGATVSDVHRGLRRGSRWAAIWELDALDAIGLLDIDGPPRDEDPDEPRRYKLNAEWQRVYISVACSPTLPSFLEERAEESLGSALRIDTPPRNAVERLLGYRAGITSGNGSSARSESTGESSAESLETPRARKVPSP